MTANEFLGQLEQCLSGIPADERESAMSYYREYFMEAGEENEDDAAAHLGSPQSVAQRIINETGVVIEGPAAGSQPKTEPETKTNSGSSNGSKIAITILVLVLGFPIWITILSLIFAFVVTLFALFIAFIAIAIAGPVSGIIDICTGYVASGLIELGSGLFSIGLVMLLWKPLCKLTVSVFQSVKNFIAKLFGRREKI